MPFVSKSYHYLCNSIHIERKLYKDKDLNDQ